MRGTETCALCGGGPAQGELVGWFADGTCTRVHSGCWIRRYKERRARDDGAGAAGAARVAPGQRMITGHDTAYGVTPAA